jgi:hypothetical protein
MKSSANAGLRAAAAWGTKALSADEAEALADDILAKAGPAEGYPYVSSRSVEEVHAPTHFIEYALGRQEAVSFERSDPLHAALDDLGIP